MANYHRELPFSAHDTLGSIGYDLLHGHLTCSSAATGRTTDTVHVCASESP